MEVLILTGMSGSGKSVAVNSLEDMGFFCIDNLPPHLLSDIVIKLSATQTIDSLGIEKLAVVVDSRSSEFFSGIEESLKQLEHEGISYKIIFLEATDETLISRYKQSRRNHPLANKSSILSGINKERALLSSLRDQAYRIISTDDKTAKKLGEEIYYLINEDADESQRISIIIQSFGFKYGMPEDSDLVIDVRFLPNPFYIEELRPLSGQDQAVVDYIYSFPETKVFLEKQLDLLLYLIPYYIREGKVTLTIAIGCTGGRHRSVHLTEELARRLRQNDYRVTAVHRDITKDPQK